MKELILILALIAIIVIGFFLSGCTYSVNLIHSEGSASDLIDENQKADADVKPNLTIPKI